VDLLILDDFALEPMSKEERSKTRLPSQFRESEILEQKAAMRGPKGALEPVRDG
jgi:hypothetical protein